MPQLLIVLALGALMAASNTVGFELRAWSLEQRWQAEQTAGVPASRLAEARREVAEEERRQVGPLPYPAVSGAALADPLGRPEASTDAAWRASMAESGQRARQALGRLRAAHAPGDDAAYYAGVVQLARAGSPARLDALTRACEAEAARQEAIRHQVEAEAGGLSGGLPADIVAATTGLEGLVTSAAATGVSAGAATSSIAAAQLYLRQPYSDLLAGHAAILAQLRTAASALQHRMDLRSHAAALLGELPDLLDQATQYGAGDDFKGRIDQARTSLDAARASSDDAAFDAALSDLHKLDDDLQAASEGRLPTAGIPCQPGSPQQLIVIHLATQQLVAYQNGCPMLRTPVTTGRPALPTGRGTFRIFYKSPEYHMISPWPQGSPFYYPPTWVSDAMEFIGDGTFLHGASWEPASAYGPGSEDGPYASHGCVHVIDGPLQQLYDWATIGTTVVVED